MTRSSAACVTSALTSRDTDGTQPELGEDFADGPRGVFLGLVAISYDSPETLKKFAESRGIRFPLISDWGSAIIKRFGVLNEEQEPGTRAYGIPHPGTFIVDRKGVVTARFFEDAYQERYTAAAILSAQGIIPAAPPSQRRVIT